MRVSFLIVVACIDLGGSYYDQTSLSSVLSAFEARLTIPRSKEAELSANESALDPTTLTASAPGSTALPTSAATRASTEVAAENDTSAATKTPTEVATESAASAATRASTEVTAENATSAATKVPMEVATENATSAATSTPTFMNDYIKEENLINKEGLLQEHEVSQIEDTVPNAALPSHFATNSGSSHTVGSVHTWTYKEVSLVAHVGQVLWLAVLTGMAFHFLGATAHLWHAVYELRRPRA